MKTNTIKLLTTGLLAHLMCFTVVLSHVHAKDAVSLASTQQKSMKLRSNDITAKALADLHHHIDKTGLKGIHVDRAATAARTRELSPLAVETIERPLSAMIHDFMLRFRVVASLCVQRI